LYLNKNGDLVTAYSVEELEDVIDEKHVQREDDDGLKRSFHNTYCA